MAWIEMRTRRKRGSSKSYQVFKVYWRDPAGKVRTKTFDRKVDAQRHARDVEHRKDVGEYVDPDAGKATLAEWTDHVIATSTHLRASTKAKYAILGSLYLEAGSLGQREIRSIGKADVRGFVAELTRTKNAATVEAVFRLMHRVLEVAVEEDQLRRNPAHGVKVEASRRREVRFLTEDEVARIAAEVPDRYRALVWTLAISGLRIGEASALRVRKVDLKKRTIHVTESSVEVAGRKVTGATKDGKDRTVDIPVELADLLVDHLERFGNRFAKDSYVFTGPEGGQIRQNAFRKRIFQPAAERAGISPVPTVHELRHTAASFYARAGLTLLEAAGQLGHSTTTMTARYSHVFPEHRQAKMGDLGALIR
jgi:integrase